MSPEQLHSREALAPVFAELNKYDATTHFVGQSTIFTIDSRSSHRGSLLPGASRHSRRSQATLDARLAPISRHVHEFSPRRNRNLVNNHIGRAVSVLLNADYYAPTVFGLAGSNNEFQVQSAALAGLRSLRLVRISTSPRASRKESRAIFA
jgi:hypothetical protein